MKRGFTLIELMVVIAIIGLLSSIVLTSLNSARDKSQIAAGESYATSVYHSAGDSLVGLWTLDDTIVSTHAIDTSGNGNTCTIIGGVTSTPGVYNSAFTFDGSTGYLSCGSSSNLNLSNKFTITFWVNPTGAGFGTLVSGDGAGDTTGAYNIYQSDNTIKYETNNLGTIVSGNALAYGKWQNIGVAYDSSATPNVKIYLNGTQIGSGTVPAPSALGYLLIGKRGVGSFFNGSIDDVRIYNQALTVSDMRALYENQLALFANK